MLCGICLATDFNAGKCSPEDGGAPHQPSAAALIASADNGCELCDLIRTKATPPIDSSEASDFQIFCNVWNWFDGPEEIFMGSSTIIFYINNKNWSVILGIAADEDSEPAVTKCVSGRRAHTSANSDACFELATKWVDNCLSEHHASCPHDATANLPTRVIDVGMDLNSPIVHLIETNGMQGIWVALSHCWGRIARFVTEATNLQERMDGIILSELPETFRDSIVITRKLGYRYIWIDSLCILQDSHQDWVDESSKMQDYYSNAILTVASDLATGDHESFLDNPRPSDKFVKVPFNHTQSSHVYITKDVRVPGRDIEETPLSVRGWTLQEDILSPRSLHYTSNELIFECQQSRFVETDATPQGYTDVDQMRSIKRFFLHSSSGLNDPLLVKWPHYAPYYEPLSRWYRLFENYCTRLLTFETDRLAAIAGLARVVQKQTGYKYRAGVWEEDMHTGLLWAISGRGAKAEKYRAPSWSWAALNISFYAGNEINPDFDMHSIGSNWPVDKDPETNRQAKILGYDVQTLNGDSFAPILKAESRMRGWMLPVSAWKGKDATYVNVYWHPIRSHQRGATPEIVERGLLTGGVLQADTEQLVLDFDESISEEDMDSDSGSYSGFGSGSELSVADSEDIEMDRTETDQLMQWRTRQYLRLMQDVVLFQIKRNFSAPDARRAEGRGVFMCLLLQPCGGREEMKYTRVGFAEAPDVEELGRDGWVEEDIIVI